MSQTASQFDASAKASPAPPLPSLAHTAVRNRDLQWIAVGGALLLAGFMIHLNDLSPTLRLALLAASAVCTSRRTAVEAVETLREFRLDVDVLMFAAAAGAAYLGHYEEGAFLLFLFGLGAAGEEMALGHAKRAIAALADVAPDTARLIREDGSVEVVPVEQVRVGDAVRVNPFDRVPIDGVVRDGASAVNQAAITGEAMPVDKTAGDDVFAGTINGEGELTIEATASADQTTLARIIELVEQAQQQRSPTQQFTATLERRYVPFVFIATGALIVGGPLVTELTFSQWFYRAMGFLVAASPCALAIGTPAAVLCGIARAAHTGVLIKGGAHLENLGRVRAVAFDKTGTLTVGRPVVTDILTPDRGLDENEALALAASIEQHVTHPLAEAITAAANDRGLTLTEASDVKQMPGAGARAMIDGLETVIGNVHIAPHGCGACPACDTLHQRSLELMKTGRTVVTLARGQCFVAVIGLSDQLREGAADAVKALRRSGIRHAVMLTGDHEGAAASITESAGLDGYEAELLPEEKLDRIDSLSREYGAVAMVGDGINDAPALARADVGIAMGAAGADAAMESADVVLMGADLDLLPKAVGLSRFSRRLIAQNLVIALTVIVIVAPLAAMGIANLGVAVLLHEGSTVLVVLNALRLLAWRDG